MSSAWRNLGEFLRFLEDKGDLVRVSGPWNPKFEMGELALRTVRKGGPALLFEDPSGKRMPVALNVLGTEQRIAWALGGETLEDSRRKIEELVQIKPPGGIGDLLSDPAGTWEKLQNLRALAPKHVSKAPCQEKVRESNDLDFLPILTTWPKDGGPTITFPLVLTKNPETGAQNVGVYRLQKYGKDTLGMHWQVHRVGAENYRRYVRRGEKMPVAVVLGADPATVFASLAPVPEGVSKFAFAGLMRGKPVEMVRCQTVDLEVPAEAEIVLEGTVTPGESHLEGPFGDHTGYYSLPEDFPVMHVSRITHRADPTYLSTVTGKPPTEDSVMGMAVSRLFLPVVRMLLPEIVDMALPMEGLFINVAVLAIRKGYPQHARKVMHAIWGLGQMMFTRYLIVVDHDVDPHDMGEVLYRVGLQADPLHDLTVVEGPVDQLSISNRRENVGGKIGIDATKKWPEEGYPRAWPEEAKMDPTTLRRVDELLSQNPALAQALQKRR
ncbi:MAG: menaquinone biosynthesis decarboxylase [Candidatus Thermoplasmatota archaeon]|jgi:4-hydroxy-3-polyprenylbenzoate decarboxylase|nr:menaquinone biosynthesis decarboxylase [Candidatus Thermoplasmatota archaeon]